MVKVKNERHEQWYAMDEEGKICFISLFEDEIDMYVTYKNAKGN